jgi:hypothetical protein
MAMASISSVIAFLRLLSVSLGKTLRILSSLIEVPPKEPYSKKLGAKIVSGFTERTLVPFLEKTTKANPCTGC